MKIDVIISADDIKESKIKDKIVVVIDMLRATSVITTALNNGASRVIPFLTVEEAFSKAKELKDNYLLGGERKAILIDGFNLSNSPLEYSKDVVNGKDIILSTTNGTRAINNCLKAKRIFIGAMINAKAITDKLAEINEDVVFVNAGTVGQFSMDDFICAGFMISKLNDLNNHELSDIATTARYIYENNPNVIEYIKLARHYSVLKNLGLEADLEYCCKKDIIDSVPEFVNGEIRLI